MLSTDELMEATAALVYPRGVTPNAKYQAAREQYRADTNALEAEWELWLAAEYLSSSVPTEAAKAVFRKAWADGHSSGYQEVEGHYEELADLVNLTVRATSK